MTQSSQLPETPSWWTEASPALRRALDHGLGPLRLKSGQTLFEQGDHDDRLYVVDDGILEVSVLSPGGRKLALHQLHSGDVFGEIAVFDPGPRTATIEARTPCRLRAIRHDDLMTALRNEPDLIRDLLQLAGRRMRWMNLQIEEQVFLAPGPRLAAKILHLTGTQNSIAMSQAELADFVGVTREVVSKTVSGWRRDGVVDATRGRITVTDRAALEAIRDAEPL